MKYISIILLALMMFSCENETKTLSADAIINKSIEVSGGEQIENSIVQFNFRDRFYYANRSKGNFSLMRVTVEEDNDSIFDVLSNDGFERYANNKKKLFVEDSMAVKYTSSVNSVHYFSVLPYGLNDKAVNKTLLEEERIKDKDYYKIKVTFNQEGGGEDYEDVFLYWIDKELFKVDYIAYSYNEDDGVGMRFREAYNERYVNKLRFVDYNNYKMEGTNIKLAEYGRAFGNKQLKLLSKIELKNIKVDLIDL